MMPNFTDNIYLLSSAPEGPESQAGVFSLRHFILQRKFYKQNRSLHDRGAASPSLLHPLFFPLPPVISGPAECVEGLGTESQTLTQVHRVFAHNSTQFIVRQSLHPQPVWTDPCSGQPLNQESYCWD